ncbi:hypothetical protein [Lactiplantibacillus plajomi]|uniref:Uncharacterized protein n=2 Tax=Lactiplantibacillus plajomi TaxID=1457217 RepID=A0ABV6K0R8_9LACO|nr:hypothetical protein [Lactiplantibacillus plajomi]
MIATQTDFDKFSNLSKPRYDFTKYISISTPKKNISVTVPLLTLDSKKAYFNAACKKMLAGFRFVTFGYYDGKLLLTFMRNGEGNEGANKLSTLGKSSLQTGFSYLAKKLGQKTDAVNLDAFVYKYKLTMVDQQHAIIDLSEVNSKRRKGEK